MTGHAAYAYFQELFDQNREISQLLNTNPKEIKNKIEDFRVEQSETDKKLDTSDKILGKYLLDALDSKKIIFKEPQDQKDQELMKGFVLLKFK